MNKYKLSTKDCIEHRGRKLYRIIALKDFADVKEGQMGGFVEKEENLSQSGNAWVYCDAKVFDNAIVSGNAMICGAAEVYGNALVRDEAHVYYNAKIYDHAHISDYTKILGSVEVCGHAWIHGFPLLYGNVVVSGKAEVYERALLDDTVRVYGKAKVHGIAHVYGNATICGTAEVDGHAVISHDAIVNDRSSYVVLPIWWASGRYTTWTRSNNMWCVYDFYGTGQELIKKAYNDSEKSGREYERLVKYVDEILKEAEK